MAVVSIAGDLNWQPLMDTIGDQLLAGFGGLTNLSQLEEALYINLEDNGPLEIIHNGPLSITAEQWEDYLAVLASLSEEAPLKVSFVGKALHRILNSIAY